MRDADHETANGAASGSPQVGDPAGRGRRPTPSDLIGGLTGRDRTQDYLSGPRTVRGRTLALASRRPLLTTALGALLMAWITVGLIFRIAQARDTVHSGWAVAVVVGLVIGAAPTAVIVRFWRGPYGRAFVSASLVLVLLYTIGVVAGGQLLFEGWARVHYVITSPLQVAAIAWTLPADAAIAVLFAGVLVFGAVTLRARSRRRTGG
jgi:hypothetical protein